MQFDALLSFTVFWTISKLLMILFSKNKWRSNSFCSTKNMNNSFTHLHLLISLSQMSSPVWKYLHYCNSVSIDWKKIALHAKSSCFHNNWKQGFLRRFRDPIRVPRIRENYHRVPKIRENRVPRIREIGSLQIQTGFLTFSLKKPWLKVKNMSPIRQAWYSPDCNTIRIATEKKTKQTRHHRKMKRS